MSEYIYKHAEGAGFKPFNDNFENRLGDNSGLHEQEHFDNLEMLLAIKRGGSCLDVGAGLGRVTAVAREIVAEVVALEPDESRWRECHRAYHREPDCQVYRQTTSEYLRQNPDKRFDLIVVSMVIQHLSTSNCDQLISEVSTLLKPDGVVIIYTTHTLEKCKGFSFSSNPERNFVPEAEFNAYTAAPPAEQTMGLPVRRFSKQDLMDVIDRADLAPIFWRQTSYYRPERLDYFAWRLNVDPRELNSVGNSQFVVAQKKR
jgi:2-polyprenyl-3-methyl-5-hydroxy-6-metoxy-1,4-benzoquinol methylase